VFGDILVDRVVRKARQRVDRFVQLNFGFIRSGGSTETKHGVDGLLQFSR
jgi:hypothetical protein